MDDPETSYLLHALLVAVFGLDLRLVLAWSEDRDALLPLLDERPSDFHPVEAGDDRCVRALQEDHEVVVEAVAVELRHDLKDPLPVVAGRDLGDGLLEEDLGAPTFLRLLERWPTADALAGAARHDLVAFARSCRHGWPERFADKVEAALTHDHFVPRDYLVRAKADTIRLAATQLLAIGAQ